MATDPDVASGDDRPVVALAGQFLHQRVAFRSPRPGGRIDELGDPEVADSDAITPDQSEEEDAG